MNALVGTTALIRLILRRDRKIIGIWIALLALVAVGTARSFAELYPVAESRQVFAAMVKTNPAMSAMLGPLFDSSIGGLTAWRIGAFVSALVGLISLLTVIRHTRTEEETGRRELLGATVVGRHAPLSAALIVAFAANLLFAAVVAAGLAAIGVPAVGSIALGLSFSATGWTYSAVAGIAAQLTQRAGGARGIAIAVLGLTYLVRFLGDSNGENGRLSWLSWSSPIGWAQRTRPFAAERWEVFVLFAIAVVALTATAYALSAGRDTGAGIVPPRLGPAAASPKLRGPLALAWRLQYVGLLAWTLGFTAAGLMLGSAATGMSEILNTSPQLKELLARIVGQATFVDTFLSSIMSLAGLVASAYAVQAALRLRSEEEGMRADAILATSVGRLRWAASHLVFAALGPAVVLAAVGVAAGLSYALSAGDLGRDVPRALTAAMVQLPAVWVVAGLAVALFGLAPRFVALTWGALLAFLILGQLGPILRLSQWIIDLSPFAHVPMVLVGEAPAAPLLWLLAVATALAFAGLSGLRRRDLSRA